MKKFCLFLFFLLINHINICQAELSGKLSDKIENSIIKEFFPEYTKRTLYKNNSEILAIYDDSSLLGYIFSTWDIVKSLGYDRSPYEIIVGLNTNGTLSGAKLTFHTEPLFKHDINEEDLLDFVKRSRGINLLLPMKRVNRNEPIRPDTVHRGTISSNLMHEAIFKSARIIARTTGLLDKNTASKLNYLIHEKQSWNQLKVNGYIQGKQTSFKEVKDQLESKGFNPELSDDLNNNSNSLFSDLYIGLFSHPMIGKNIIAEYRYDKLLSQIGAKDHVIFLASNGYSHRGKNWRTTKNFERISIIQNDTKIKFTASDYTRLSTISANGAPKFKELSLFKISSNNNFIPSEDWGLELIYESKDGGSEKIILNYSINKNLVIIDPKAGKEIINNSIWTETWLQSKFRISILVVFLILLIFITIFQDYLMLYRKQYKILRICYLTFTLLWIGWYTGAQLSIFNILSVIKTPINGFDISYFLIDPLIFILLIFTIISALILGRGLFCGWLCPFGAFQELVTYIGKKFKISQLFISERLNRRLWSLKYFILLSIIGSSFISMETTYLITEVEPFKTAIMTKFNRGLPYVLYAIALLLLSLFLERGFCRYACPLGASIAIIGKLRFTDFLKRRKECGSPCNLCTSSCPVQAIPSNGKQKGKIIMSECFRCLDCQLEYFDDTRCPPLVKGKG